MDNFKTADKIAVVENDYWSKSVDYAISFVKGFAN